MLQKKTIKIILFLSITVFFIFISSDLYQENKKEAHAAGEPEITSHSGIFSHNQTVTISGNNFGTKNSASPFLWDDFEEGAEGARVGSTNTKGWSESSVDPNTVTYSGENNVPGSVGSLTSKHNLIRGSLGTNVARLISPTITSDPDKLFISFWHLLMKELLRLEALIILKDS